MNLKLANSSAYGSLALPPAGGFDFRLQNVRGVGVLGTTDDLTTAKPRLIFSLKASI